MAQKPKTPFSEITLVDKWSAFGKILQSEGELNMASIINVNKPIFKNDKIIFALPNQLMSNQFGTIKPRLLRYLKEALNNYKIQIETIVLQEDKNTYIYTPQEKFKKLADANPDVLLLKSTFGLDV